MKVVYIHMLCYLIPETASTNYFSCIKKKVSICASSICGLKNRHIFVMFIAYKYFFDIGGFFICNLKLIVNIYELFADAWDEIIMF